MSDRPLLSTPTAILLGSAMIAAGAYFGLRARPAPVPEVAAPVVVAPAGAEPTSASASPSSAPAPSPATPDRDAVVARARADAAAAVAAQRGRMAKACGALLAPSPPPGPRVHLDLSFDPSGREVARGVLELRGQGQPGLGACIAGAVPPITVSPPGATTRVEVPVELP
jgi:hypothetical protein